MGKREFDKMKHTAQAYQLGKKGKASKGGWGDPLEDYKQGWEAEDEYEEDYYDENEILEEEAKPKPVSEWTKEEVGEWIRGINSNLEDAAKEFEACDITGSLLFDLDIGDVEATIGKGLRTKKLWTEIRTLLTAADARTNDKRIPVVWMYFTPKLQWRRFPIDQNYAIEQAYQNRHELMIRGWTLKLQKKKPYAVNRSFCRLLRRKGKKDRKPLIAAPKKNIAPRSPKVKPSKPSDPNSYAAKAARV